MATRIKICGISQAQDAAFAAQLGVDAIGLVFYPPSPRFVEIAQAREIVSALPPFVSVVGLFVDATVDQVAQVVEQVPIDVLQFQGEETPEECRDILQACGCAKPYLKAIRMREGVDLADKVRRYGDAAALLLDAYQEGVPGGTGAAFDWSRVPAGLDKPIILAGGLNAHNVAEAMTQVRPYAIDVSGGVESSKGIKNQGKMAAFVAAVRAADAALDTAQ
jgi:phosphoribosylanthranilate isomerase